MSDSNFFKKLLGKNYKWWYLLKYEYKRSKGHFNTFIFLNFIRTLEFIAMIYVWQFNQASATIITYLALGRVYIRLTNTGMGSILAGAISRGNHTKILILPINTTFYYILQDIGFNKIRQLQSSAIILILAYLFFGKDLLLPNLSALWLIPLAILTMSIIYFVNIIIGCISFWVTDTANNGAIIEGIFVAINILSGMIIPLDLFFKNQLTFLQYTPFAYFLHLPMQIYLGKYSPVETFYVFLGGLAWCASLYFLAKFVFKMGLKKNESVGL